MNKTNPDEPCRLACTEPPQCDGEQLESFGITSNEVIDYRKPDPAPIHGLDWKPKFYRSGQCGPDVQRQLSKWAISKGMI
jgi:hypothetical protein